MTDNVSTAVEVDHQFVYDEETQGHTCTTQNTELHKLPGKDFSFETFEREYYINPVVITSQGFDTVLAEFNPWELWFQNLPALQLSETYSMWKADCMCINIRIGCHAALTGAVVVCYNYGDPPPANPVCYTSLPGSVLMLSPDAHDELMIPWVFNDRANKIGTYPKLNLRVFLLTPLISDLTSDEERATVFISYRPKGVVGSLIQPSVAVAESKITRSDILDALLADDIEDDDPEDSSVRVVAARDTSSTKVEPPKGVVASSNVNISPPQSQRMREVACMLPQLPPTNNIDSHPPVHVLAPHSGNHVDPTMPSCIREENETDIAAISSIPTCVARYSFANTDLVPIVVTPQWAPDGFSPGGGFYLTPAGAVASLASYWRGTCRVTLMFVNPPTRNGRVEVTLFPNATAADASSLEQSRGQDCYKRIINVIGNTTVSFDVPFLSYHYWQPFNLSNPANNHFSDTGGVSDDNHAYTRILVRQLYNQSGLSSGHTQLTMLVWFSWPDLQIGLPHCAPPVSFDWQPTLAKKEAVGEGLIREVGKEAEIFHPDLTGAREAGATLAAVNVTDIRQLLSFWQYACSVDLSNEASVYFYRAPVRCPPSPPEHPTDWPLGASSIVPEPGLITAFEVVPNTLMRLFGHMFDFWTGSIDCLMWAHPSSKVELRGRSRPTAFYGGSGWSGWADHTNLVLIDAEKQPVNIFRVPWRSPYAFDGTENTQGYAPAFQLTRFFGDSETNLTHRFYTRIGDDFNFAFCHAPFYKFSNS